MSHHSVGFSRTAGLGLLSALGVLVLTGAQTASAQNIETGNPTSIFAGKPVSVSSTYPASIFAAGNLVDGSVQSFIFNDGQATEYANISGFTVAAGSAITTLRFFDEPGFNSRTSPSVTIYSSSSGTTILDPTNAAYTLVGTFALPYNPALTGTNNPDDYQIATNPIDTSANNNKGTIYYDNVTLSIGAGTKSLLFSFAQDPNFINGPGGTSLSEIQGFVTATPEPSQTAAMGLGVLGLASLAFTARKRNASRLT